MYTVPLGFIAVLRDLDVYCDPGSGSVQVFLEGSLGQSMWFDNFAGGGSRYGSWRGRQVLRELEGVTIRSNGPADVTLSGYLLTLP